MVANVAEEAVVEELSPYEKLFTTVVPEQGLVAAATFCFCVFPAANLVTDEFKCQSDKFNYQREEFICQSNKFNCQNQ